MAVDVGFIVSMVVIFVIGAITMPAGIGGGILFVPILQIIAGEPPRYATALSQVLITGAAVASILHQVIWQSTHKSSALLASPYFAYAMVPSLLAGSVIGVFLAALLPVVVSLVCLVVVSIIASITIFKKGVATYRRENRVMEASRQSGSPQPPVPPDVIGQQGGDLELCRVSSHVGSTHPPPTHLEVSEGEGDDDESIPAPMSFLYDPKSDQDWNTLESMAGSGGLQAHSPTSSITSLSVPRELRSRRRVSLPTPPTQEPLPLPRSVSTIIVPPVLATSGRAFMLRIFFLWAANLLWVLIRGGSRTGSIIPSVHYCGGAYWVLSALQVVLLLPAALWWNLREFKLIIFTFLTGIVVTLAGVSGGIVMNPILMARGLSPQEASATSAVAIIVMASISSAQYLLGGVLPLWNAALALITFVGAMCGLTVVTWLVNKLGRQSLIIFLLGVMVVIGGALTLGIGISSVVQELARGESPFALGQVC